MLLKTRKLTKSYKERKDIFYAVKQASIHISEGETVGIWGNSGCGKTTLGMMLAGLLRPSGGEIYYQGAPLSFPFKGENRRMIQMMFQHPELSFNPKLRVIHSLREPYKMYSPPYTLDKLLSDMENLGLYEEHLNRYPAELSGGELQRFALLRLLVLKPSLIVLDEPTSMLDVISQAQVLDLLNTYQKNSGAAFLFISHHKMLVKMLCDRIYTVEQGILDVLAAENNTLQKKSVV